MPGTSPIQESKVVAEVKALTQLVRSHRDQAVADFAVRDIADNAGFPAFDQRRRLLTQAFRIAEFLGMGEGFRSDLEFRVQTLGNRPGVAKTDLGTFVVPFVLKYATTKFSAANSQEEQQRIESLWPQS